MSGKKHSLRSGNDDIIEVASVLMAFQALRMQIYPYALQLGAR